SARPQRPKTNPDWIRMWELLSPVRARPARQVLRGPGSFEPKAMYGGSAFLSSGDLGRPRTEGGPPPRPRLRDANPGSSRRRRATTPPRTQPSDTFPMIGITVPRTCDNPSGRSATTATGIEMDDAQGIVGIRRTQRWSEHRPSGNTPIDPGANGDCCPPGVSIQSCRDSTGFW